MKNILSPLKQYFVPGVFILMVCSIISSSAFAVVQQDSIYSLTIWKIHPGKHQEFIQYMQEWEEVFIDIKQPPMIWYRKISGDNYDFVSISPPFNHEVEKAMELAGRKRGLPIGYNYTLKLNALADSYTTTLVEGPQSMQSLLKQTQ